MKNTNIFFMNNGKKLKFLHSLLLLLSALILLNSCQNSKGEKEKQGLGSGASIAVFIPGVMAGSAIYQMLADGATQAVEEFAAANPSQAPSVTVIEGGFNQAEWENQVTTLAASGAYDLIISSNPSLPVIVTSVSAKFPEQKFLLLDGELEGNSNVYTLYYNQREQSYMAGYIAALISLEMDTNAKRIGLVAGQEYPVMGNVILPGFTEGARAVDPAFSVDFRIVGNWYDAAKAAELGAGMIRDGVKVLLPVAGGAGVGVIQAAAESGAKIVWFDTNGYAQRPGVIIGSAVLNQDKAAYEKTMLYLNGQLPFGTAEIAGITEGLVDFIEDDPLYISSVSEAVRDKQSALITRLRSGELKLP